MQRLNIYTAQGGVTVSTGGVSSTTLVMGVYPGSTITVFDQGTLNLTSIFSDNGVTPKANPFTSDATTGLGFFYAANGRVDIQISGTGFTTFTLADILLNDPAALVSPFTGVFISATANPASTGVLRLASADQGPTWRNNANNADLGWTKNASDVLNWPGAMTIAGTLGLGTNALTAGGFISGNASPATTGTLRFANADTAKVRNAANSADLNLWSMSTNVLVLGDAGGISVQGITNSGGTTISGVLSLANGTAAAPSLAFTNSPTTGIYREAANVIGVSIAGTLKDMRNSSGWLEGSGQVFAWASTTDPSAGVADTGLSRTAAATVAVGNGTAGDASGTLSFKLAKAYQFQSSSTTDFSSSVGSVLELQTGFASPNSTRLYWGDGTGYKLSFSKRVASTDTDFVTLVDSSGGQLNLGSTGVLGFTSSGGSTGTVDTGLSRTAAATVALGNGTALNASGTLALANIKTGAGSSLAIPATGANVVSDTATQTLTGKTLTSPVINGTPTGTGIPTVTLKKGSAAGSYSHSGDTNYTQVDGTNLTYTVTIPTGWKLAITSAFRVGTLTAAVACNVGIADGGTVVVETVNQTTAAGVLTSSSLAWVITGDGASHTIDLRYKTSNAADAVSIGNTSATDVPTMVFILTPSN